jgi:hypothetical protein
MKKEEILKLGLSGYLESGGGLADMRVLLLPFFLKVVHRSHGPEAGTPYQPVTLNKRGRVQIATEGRTLAFYPRDYVVTMDGVQLTESEYKDFMAR